MNLNFLTYKDFKAVDFFQDPAFSSYVLSPNNTDRLFWEELQRRHPLLAEEMRIATNWILLIREQPVYTGALSQEVRWQNIQDKLPSYARKQQNRAVVKKMVRWSSRIAAVFLAVFLMYEINQMGTKQSHAGYGEQKEVLLPDESKINLNSNSKISYVRDWKSDKPREVWLSGEAMFEVKHTAVFNRLRKKDHFVVHVGDLSLTVLGTRFNVKERRNRIEVTLFEGSLRINREDDLQHILKPGETFIYDSNEEIPSVEKKDVASVEAWTREELDVENSNLSNLIEIIEDNYGYQVVLTDSALLQKRLTGTIPVTNIDDILFVIKHTMDVSIRKDNKQIIINRNQHSRTIN